MDTLDSKLRWIDPQLRAARPPTLRLSPGDRSLQRVLRQLLAARHRAGLTQKEVARRMCTTKSAISRLERGRDHRPLLTTIENYALVVGCSVEITLQPYP